MLSPDAQAQAACIKGCGALQKIKNNIVLLRLKNNKPEQDLFCFSTWLQCDKIYKRYY